MNEDREILFKVTAADFDRTDIRGSGPGGQHRNKNSTGVRLVHRESGAVGEATDSKSQETNKINAFKRLRETPEWKTWFRQMVLLTSGQETNKQQVERLMDEKHIITQVLDEKSRWVDVHPSELTDEEA